MMYSIVHSFENDTRKHCWAESWLTCPSVSDALSVHINILASMSPFAQQCIV